MTLELTGLGLNVCQIDRTLSSKNNNSNSLLICITAWLNRKYLTKTAALVERNPDPFFANFFCFNSIENSQLNISRKFENIF